MGDLMSFKRKLVGALPRPLATAIKDGYERLQDYKRAKRVRTLLSDSAMEYPDCAICDRNDTVPHKTFNGFKIVRCRHDGLMFVSPRPTDVGAFYTEQYYKGDISGYKDYEAFSEEYAPHWIRRLDLMATVQTGRRVLDVGCATGAFLALAREHGWETSGIELSEWAAARARDKGLNVLQGSLPDDRLPGEAYDVVTIFDCIEHVFDPEAVLRDIRRVIAPEGNLILTTGALVHEDPDLVSQWYFPPWHLFYFSEETIRALLAKCGFEVISYEEEDKHIPEYGLMVVVARPLHGKAVTG